MKSNAPLALLLLTACSQGTEPAPEAVTSGEPSAMASDAAAAIAPAALIIAAPDGPVSRYTSLKDCKLIDDGGGEDWSVSRCRGLGGFDLRVKYFDARDSLEVLRGDRVIGEMPLWLRGGGGFNAVGDTVEWRGIMQGGVFTPRALIVRNHVIRDTDQPDRSTGVLEVIDLKRGCMAGSVEPQAGQNEAARAIGDALPEKCFTYQPER